MSTHNIRQEKWETLRDHLETIADQLAEVQDIAEELREDYSHTGQADARLEKLDDLSVLLEQAAKAIEDARERLRSR